MATTNARSWWWLAVVAALTAGAASALWAGFGRPEQPPAMPPEQFMEKFKEADKVDRENWERMWREAGKKPPPAPR